MVNDYQLVMNALARGLELERQNTDKDIGLDMPIIFSSLHPNSFAFARKGFRARAVVTINDKSYDLTMRLAGGKGVHPTN